MRIPIDLGWNARFEPADRGHAGQAGSLMGPANAGPAPQVGDRNGAGWHSAHGGRGGDWIPEPQLFRPMEGHWARSHSEPFRWLLGLPEAWSIPYIGWVSPTFPTATTVAGA